MSTAIATQGRQSNARILIVEDEGLIAYDIETRLHKAGYEVAGIVDTGEEVLDKIRQTSPDLILMDIRLRGRMDGIETARQVQLHHDVPIIYLTAHSDRETLERAKITGPFGYLTKPLVPGSLPTSIEVALYKHQTERELRQQKAWLRTTLESMADGMIVVDHLGRIRHLNAAAENLTGWNAGAAVNHPVSKVLRLFHAEHGEWFNGLLPASLPKGNATSFPAGLKLMTRNDQRISVEGEIAASTADGIALGAVITFRDVTQREAQETERRHEQKMQAVGQLAAGVAHDFNNHLTVILGQASLLLTGEDELAEPVRLGLEEIRKGAGAAAAVTKQLLTFGRREVIDLRLVDLNAVIRDNEQVCRRLPAASVVWKISLEPRLKLVYADSGLLAQVLINLVANARDAMPEGGVLTISTENVELEISGDMGTYVEEYVALTVADTGSGMDSTLAEHIFEPFFTTKPDQGTGLGLSIVHTIVTDAGGNITVESQPGKGSNFQVFFPVAQRDMKTAPRERTRLQLAPDRRKTILVVDDDQAVRDILHKSLESLGYIVLQAADGHQALALADQYSGQIDALVTDVVMPKMNGLRLAEQLTRVRPNVRTLFVSGYDDNILDQKSEMLTYAHFLQKPFLHDDLRFHVERLFEDDAAGLPV